MAARENDVGMYLLIQDYVYIIQLYKKSKLQNNLYTIIYKSTSTYMWIHTLKRYGVVNVNNFLSLGCWIMSGFNFLKLF